MISPKSTNSYLDSPDKQQISSSHQNIHRLNRRWNCLDLEIDKDKQYRHSHILQQIAALENNVHTLPTELEPETKALKDDLQTLNKTISEIKGRRIKSEEHLEQKTDGLRELVSSKLNCKSKKIEEHSTYFEQNIDQKIIQKCEEFEIQRKINQSQMGNVLSQVSGKLSKLESVVVQNRNKREVITEEVTSYMQVELNKLHNKLNVGSKVREQTQSKLFKMVKQIRQKLQGQMQVEREERSKTNNAIMRLLEETCYKAEGHFR